MSSGIDSAAVKEIQQSDSGPVAPECARGAATLANRPGGARALKAALHATVVLCLATTLAHIVLVFLHVAPANTVSKRYSPQISAWVYPLFEQNWRLFAPEPDSVNRQILARAAHTRADGSMRVSAWFDLAAEDNARVEHQVFPSHTAQNLLRRAWTSYTDSHGGDDHARTERAVMMQKYLRNIAADRVTARHAGRVDFIQLRVVTVPIAAPGSAAGNRPPASVETRLLPWWKVSSDGN